MKLKWKITFGASAVALIALIIIGFAVSARSNTKTDANALHVVAGENFWGSLIAQLGGSHVTVTSVASDPDADPHEFESSNITARTFAQADYVVLNGAGYDSWGDKLLEANPTPNRRVLNVATLLGKNNGDNPHFWYDPAYVNKVVERMSNDLIVLDPEHTADYQKNLQTVRAALTKYQERIADIKLAYAGTNVAATEDIFVYLAQAAELNLTSPPAFIEAVAEGNDPPTASVAEFHHQLESGNVKALVYNKQTVTPLTESVKKLATEKGIPIVGITETVQPQNEPFQDWMNVQVADLEKSLEKAKSNE
jgi:zinc/manganese transport system substrate-binding protein